MNTVPPSIWEDSYEQCQ